MKVRRRFLSGVFRNPGVEDGSPAGARGVEIEATDVESDDVAVPPLQIPHSM